MKSSRFGLFIYLFPFFNPLHEPCSRCRDALYLNHAVVERRQFNLVAASPPGMWAMWSQIQVESKSIPVELVPVRWSKVFQPLGRKRSLLFEAVGVNRLSRWHKGRVFTSDLPGCWFSIIFISDVCSNSAQCALQTPTCNCRVCYWRYEPLSPRAQTCTWCWAKHVCFRICTICLWDWRFQNPVPL